MKITVFGAEGEIGQKVISYALSQGVFVTACICDVGILWPRKNLTVIEGTVTSREKVMEAMLEADIVISALTGECLGKKGSDTPVADANATIISAMEQLGKTRLVVLGSVLYSRVRRSAGAAAASAPKDYGNSLCGKNPGFCENRTDCDALTPELDTCARGEFPGKRQWGKATEFLWTAAAAGCGFPQTM